MLCRISVSTCRTFSLLFLLALLASSCSVSRRVPEGMYLLDGIDVEVNDGRRLDVSGNELMPYIRQKPNKKILGFRFHLRIHNAAKPYSYNRINRWLKTVGEEPVLLDTFLIARSTDNISRYLQSKGFYHSVVNDTVLFHKKNRAKVIYSITPNAPYRITNIKHFIEDPEVKSIVLSDTTNSLLKSGSRFDMDILNRERSRVEATLREEGYYYFSRDFITYAADTTIGGRGVILDFQIRNRTIRSPFGEAVVKNYKKYKIDDIFIYPNYDPLQFYHYRQSNLLDTLNYNDVQFVYSQSLGVQPQVLYRANLIRTNDYFRESVVNRTRRNFNSLGLYRMVNVYFEAKEETQSDADVPFMLFSDDSKDAGIKPGLLTSHVQLSPHTLQSFQVDMVGTTSSQEFGLETNVNYQHKNILKGAEILDVKLKAELKAIENKDGGYSNAVEYGTIVGFNIPRYVRLIPIREMIDKHNPRTIIASQYNYQDRPDYTRTIAGMNFGYSWGNNRFLMHSITPVDVSVINIFSITPEFSQHIDTLNIAASYKNQVVTTSGYGLTFNNQNIQKKESFTFFRLNTELSGNMLNLVHPMFAEESDDGTRKVFNTSYSQFVRGDVNIVYNHVVDQINTFAYRAYLGLGYPYGNSTALPFEKKYFSGGSGLRGWQARRLGPGTYVDEVSRHPNQSADIKLEANFEYRFALLHMLEGALFVDAGNIWAITTADERPGAMFHFNKFYRQIAIGSGLGLRVNLGFFLVRLDLGVKVYDPGIKTELTDSGEPAANAHWIPFQRPYEWSDFVPHFGIGYPF